MAGQLGVSQAVEEANGAAVHATSKTATCEQRRHDQSNGTLEHPPRDNAVETAGDKPSGSHMQASGHTEVSNQHIVVGRKKSRNRFDLRFFLPTAN